MVLSPITHQPAEIIKNIPVKVIIDSYKEEVGLDVASYFSGLKEVSVYKCKQTAYRFYHPFNLAGDSKLYEDLQKFDWYYFDWKWDYTVADKIVMPGQVVLDIGCGYGDFLRHLKEKKQCECTGLEFNDNSIKVATERGVKIYKEFVQDHANDNAGKYDVVSYFHLLEHITDIESFVSASIKCLKPGGKLIICVPNNNPYCYQFKEYHSLNMPPHHMGMWDETSLNALQNIFPVKVDRIYKETLLRCRHYTDLYLKDKAGDNRMKKLVLSFLKPIYLGYFILAKSNIEVGNIMAVYTKDLC